MFFLLKDMIFCLSITIIIESVVAFIIGIRNKKDFINIVIVNCMTNPLVVSIPVYFNILYGSDYRNIAYVLLEIFAFISEGLVYYKVLNYRKINPFLVSIILNGFSLLAGELTGSLF